MKNQRRKIGPNDPCPCGSGLKYKKCCRIKASADRAATLRDEYTRKHKIRFKTTADLDGIRQAGRVSLAALELVEEALQPGLTTEAINTLVHDYTVAQGGTPAPLNYRGFPKSVCVSVNDVICHGIPGERILRDGDIVNVDVTTILDGYYADVNKTFFVGTPDEAARKIVAVARECLHRGMEQIRSGNHIGDIGWAIQRYAEMRGCSVVREFIGHGVGFDFHEAPQVPHYGHRGEGLVLLPGMVFTVEPMINLGARHLRILDDQWTAVTQDGSLSAQFEQTLVVTESGYESLTPFD